MLSKDAHSVNRIAIGMLLLAVKRRRSVFDECWTAGLKNF
jgi:hypothetical protein